MPRRTELPYLPELLDLLDLARVGGYDGSLDDFKHDLMNRPEVIPFPPSQGSDFNQGGLVGLMNSGIGRLFRSVA